MEHEEKDTKLVATFIKESVNEKLEEIMKEKKWSRALLLRTIIEAHVNPADDCETES